MIGTDGLSPAGRSLLRDLIDGAEETPPPCQQFPDLWFETNAPRQQQAIRHCRTACKLTALCAAYAIEADERDGVWGGMTPNQLRTAQRARQRIKDKSASRIQAGAPANHRGGGEEQAS